MKQNSDWKVGRGKEFQNNTIWKNVAFPLGNEILPEFDKIIKCVDHQNFDWTQFHEILGNTSEPRIQYPKGNEAFSEINDEIEFVKVEKVELKTWKGQGISK